MTYTFDEMASLGSLLAAIRGDLALFTVDSLMTTFSEQGETLTEPKHRPAFPVGLSKLKQGPRAKVSDWLTGRADWCRRGEDVFELDLKPGAIL